MSLQWKILGHPGADNALFLTVDSGQAVDQLLFDCGENCLTALRPSQIQSIGHLSFSHFHMDHVAGFDTFFRHNYNRPDTPVHVWGPDGTIERMHHRFRSFSWNLHHNQPGEWLLRETDGREIRGARLLTREAFATAHPLPSMPTSGTRLFETSRFSLDAFPLPHGTIPSLAYRVTEAPRKNICPDALQRSGLSPGAWLQALSDESRCDEERLAPDGRERSLGSLRADLLRTTPGESLAYLTDFRVERNSAAWNALSTWLQGTNVLISECQYLDCDKSLALQNGHMTSGEVGQLASDAGVDSLVLQHLSRRYAPSDWSAMLREAREAFPRTRFPPEWQKLT